MVVGSTLQTAARRSFYGKAAAFWFVLVGCSGFGATVPTPAQELCPGQRFVAIDGSDFGNDCRDGALPCRSIQHAIDSACDGELVRVGEGDYTEDLLITHPVQIHGTGRILQTHLQGSGSTDVVKILSSHVSWGGITVWHTPGQWLMHVGDALHPGVRDVQIENGTFRESTHGILIDSTGVDEGLPWNRLSGVIVRDMQADGSPHGGTGILMIGGNGRWQLSAGRLHHDAGGGLRVLAPTTGNNGKIVVSGQFINDNGTAPLGPSRAGVEVHAASDLQIEGNEFFAQNGTDAPADGIALILDGVQSGTIACNRFHDGEAGVELRGTTQAVALVSNSFAALTSTALTFAESVGSGLSVHETLFDGSAKAIVWRPSTTLNATHNWFGAAAPPTTNGDTALVTGLVDTANFIARATAPALVRRPQNSGWSFPQAACYERLQEAVDGAADHALLLVGEGEYFEHVTIAKPLELEGLPAVNGCSPSILRGDQADSHLPTLRLDSVSGAAVRALTIRSAGQSGACGAASGEEIGLDLRNVDHSVFSQLCLRENGVTELRLYGNTDDNQFSDIDIDGLLRDQFGRDICGHRSREGVLIDGGAACLGGPGAIAERNQFTRLSVAEVTRGIEARLARATTLSQSTLHAAPAAAWDGGASAIGVALELAEETNLTGNVIGDTATLVAVRVAGRSAGSCVTELVASRATSITGNELHGEQIGIHLAQQPSDSGGPGAAQIACNAVRGATVGLLVGTLAPSDLLATVVHRNDISGNATGLQNLTTMTLDAQANWWGNASGPSGGGGSGDLISGPVNAAGYLSGSAVVDVDGDGLSYCSGDCGPTDASIFPGAPEICDLRDNDCDARVDNAPLPSGRPAMHVSRTSYGAARLEWNAVVGATGYDIVRGSGQTLRSSAGDFGVATTSCLGDAASSTLLFDTGSVVAGDAAWYLVRAVNCGGKGTYDSSGGGQRGLRDAEIDASSGVCP